ncbi:DUF732 domain-containing protein [Rhodococcus sp. Z13]|uniref:DUF732 domain-containing protein n=1 Tax=Rhodococcus sacchari TaxID=2962047 RepID=A0ACD4DGU2_9NOCA|nr:DUF732 domain-containing protein [Rhodococcus sp. Z13]UYP19204.1 DUF732 domain-containing protein [Rhodococcus sp. Z13]
MTKRMFISAVLTGAVALTLSACGGGDDGSSASGTEDTYITRLSEAGIDGDRDALLAVGNETCDLVRNNAGDGDVEAAEMIAGFTEPARKAGYEPFDTVTIGMASVTTLCTDLLGEETAQQVQEQWEDLLSNRNTSSGN